MSPVTIKSLNKLFVYKSAQRLSVVPSLYSLSKSGIISLATSALKSMLSVSASPSCMLPSAVILPVACILPFTVRSENISTDPVPLGLSSRSVFVEFVLITFPVISMSSTRNLF